MLIKSLTTNWEAYIRLNCMGSDGDLPSRLPRVWPSFQALLSSLRLVLF